MPTAVPKQTGTEVEVGFQGFTMTGYLPEDGFQIVRNYSEMEEIFDINGAVRTKIRVNPFTEWSGSLVVDAGKNFLFTEGDTISITPATNAGTAGTAVIAEIQNGSAVQLNRKSIRLNITLRKEDSMTYTT